MPFVTVKPKFQVTIPAKLRRDIDLREGDIMEATLVSDGILFKPKEVVDRAAPPTASLRSLRRLNRRLTISGVPKTRS